jgi:flavin-dependent dehydrogenase
MKEFDVVIIGAGLAGLQCARLLSRQGIRVLLADRKHDLTKGIHTTGIFVRKTLEDFHFPSGTLGAPVRNVTLYSPKLRAFNLESGHDEFRVGKMGELYKTWLDECVAAGVEFANGTRYVSARPTHDTVIVRLEKGGRLSRVAAKVLVGADGAVSRVARDLGLDENTEWIVGYEEILHSK